ncbi:hypothetical protein SAY87_010022 [Trapa incisa]|uniref:Protein kinase domain-containing protein n=1 Tax=Trapa incisa TaxID=236973 RepID=A0AAN7JHT5_9MYRT|nr:hypothetical protein SAY87_010022 [Trapa incisa]
MEVRRNPLGFHLPCYLVLIILVSQIQGYWSVNHEGLALLRFKEGVYSDPDGALANWDPNHDDPCRWSGVHCIKGKVYILNLTGYRLKGIVSPELGKLNHLRYLLLCGNSLEGSIPSELEMLSHLSELQINENFKTTLSNGPGGMNRKLGPRLQRTEPLNSKASCYTSPAVDTAESQETRNIQSGINFNILRRKLLEESRNLEVPPASTGSMPMVIVLVTRSSGAFPAVPSVHTMHKSNPSSPPPLPQKNEMDNKLWQASWKYIVIITSSISLFCLAALSICIMCQKRGAKTIAPWKAGISGQLQKAFVTGVPKLDQSELETACEDFSNIICSIHGSTLYKGNLSNAVEIAVVSTSISLNDWSPNVQKAYRRKLNTLSRVNHKNFINLIGYCEEDEPFTRMMVFEYAPNGSLFEHLHLKEFEPLDWNTRVRIIMGIAYCLEYLHHEVNLPMAHGNLNSTAIFLTDDYAAKVAKFDIWPGTSSKSSTGGKDKSRHSELSQIDDPEENVYDFGLILLEIISGKLPSEEKGALVDLVAEHLNSTGSITCLVDPTLKSFKNNELDLICEIIKDCIKSEPKKRPIMKEIASKLREVINISPEKASPRISPLWWAELEILSEETT